MKTKKQQLEREWSRMHPDDRKISQAIHLADLKAPVETKETKSKS